MWGNLHANEEGEGGTGKSKNKTRKNPIDLTDKGETELEERAEAAESSMLDTSGTQDTLGSTVSSLETSLHQEIARAN